jgi:hypothetical protein
MPDAYISEWVFEEGHWHALWKVAVIPPHAVKPMLKLKEK